MRMWKSRDLVSSALLITHNMDTMDALDQEVTLITKALPVNIATLLYIWDTWSTLPMQAEKSACPSGCG